MTNVLSGGPLLVAPVAYAQILSAPPFRAGTSLASFSSVYSQRFVGTDLR